MNRYPLNLKDKQQGFSIVMAIFILVVLGLLGAYMVRLAGVQQATANYALQGARAYQAARAGLGWGAAKIGAGGTCVDVNGAALTFADLSGFTVSLTCTSATYQEGGDTPIVYQINAHSEYGTYGDPDYVSRELELSTVK